MIPSSPHLESVNECNFSIHNRDLCDLLWRNIEFVKLADLIARELVLATNARTEAKYPAGISDVVDRFHLMYYNAAEFPVVLAISKV